MACIGSPNSCMDGDGVIRLSKIKSYIPSNIQKGKTVTQVFFNIDWKNKNVQQTETHHANLILVQKCDTKEDMTKIYSEPKYEFDRKKYRSYKASTKICQV